jgi:ubiquinone/menaquinone biosynthesis C-methylase UbiE
MDLLKTMLLNRRAENMMPDEVIKALQLQRGQDILDIGAGGGYYTFRFAEEVGPGGRVYAADTKKEFVEQIRKKAEEKKLANVEAMTPDSFYTVPPASVDLIYLRNVYHHLKDRTNYFGRLMWLLKPEGRIAVIEYKKTRGLSYHNIFGHNTYPERIIEEMSEAGYSLMEKHDFLPEQSFTIYKKKSN